MDATGAVYGSLLAASVVVGQAPLQESVPPVDLAVILLATGAVFWLVHVYSRTLGHYVIDGRFHRHRLAHVMREESPIILAAIPPAVAALVVGAPPRGGHSSSRSLDRSSGRLSQPEKRDNHRSGSSSPPR